jgi:hypothetical protein
MIRRENVLAERLMPGLTPEQRSRQQIDVQLVACGWIVQDFNAVDFSAGRGIAIREVPHHWTVRFGSETFSGYWAKLSWGHLWRDDHDQPSLFPR